MEVAGAIVSDKAAREWVASNNALRVAVDALAAAMEANTRALAGNTTAANDAAKNAHEAEAAIRQLSIELVRNQGRTR